MSADVDYYAVLSVLPDAEHVVIVAAYRDPRVNECAIQDYTYPNCDSRCINS